MSRIRFVFTTDSGINLHSKPISWLKQRLVELGANIIISNDALKVEVEADKRAEVLRAVAWSFWAMNNPR